MLTHGPRRGTQYHTSAEDAVKKVKYCQSTRTVPCMARKRWPMPVQEDCKLDLLLHISHELLHQQSDMQSWSSHMSAASFMHNERCRASKRLHLGLQPVLCRW